MSDKDGGNAFPINHHPANGRPYPYSGMTLRDYFAAAALQGALASNRDMDWQHSKVAAFCYEQADAMLAAGSK